jgi:hypothetical protein
MAAKSPTRGASPRFKPKRVPAGPLDHGRSARVLDARALNHTADAFLGTNGRWEKPHFLATDESRVFSQVFDPQAETPNCHLALTFFPKFLYPTTAKTVASLQFLGKV